MVTKALVVGMGSMGRRRARLLKQINKNLLVCGVDSNPERVNQTPRENFDVVFSDLNQAIRQFRPDVAIISTSPAFHHIIIPVFLEQGIHVFTELNLISDGYEEMIHMAEEKNCTLFLSSTLLYRKDLQYIIAQVQGKRVNYLYHAGQYLPDWHPWESYKNFFVQETKTNGCREIFAIDLPWILAAMGPVKEFHAYCGNLTKLEVSYPDNFMVQILHENGTKGIVSIDVVTRKAVRDLEVYSEEIYLRWNGNPNALYQYNFETKNMDQIHTYGSVDKDRHYSDTIIENAYEDELRTFFEVIEKRAVPRYTFLDDWKTLELVDQIERCAEFI